MAKEYFIGDFLKRIKRPMKIDADQYYNLVTVKLYHKGVKLREVKKGSQIESNMYEIKEGDFILSGIDARNGAFGIVPKYLHGAVVTNDFWYFEIDEKIINKHLFLELTATSWFDDICKKGSDGTTQRIRLQKDKFFTQKIVLPEIEDQPQILDKVNNLKSNNTQFLNEVQNQHELLTALRQAILTEAVQGQLTAQWRKENPKQEHARELLKRIAAEKAQLIKEKKIGKEKPLPAIKEEEVPYALPEGWVWCRLGEVIELISGQHIEASDYNNRQIGVPYLTGPSDFGDKHPVFTRWSSLPKVLAKNNDILITVKGSGVGKLNILHVDDVAIGRQLMGIRGNYINRDYIYLFLDSNYSELQNQKIGVAIPGIGRDDILFKFFPLPPLPEQHAIVQKVNTLLAYCDELEQQVKQSKADLDLLMQSVLSEVFGIK